MKALVVYDSVNGNTEQIAKAIAEAISGAELKRASEVTPENLEKLSLLIAGAPTQGGRPAPVMLTFLNKMADKALDGVMVAAFDTRMPARWVKIFGFAAGKIADTLKKQGGNLVTIPEGFFVKTAKGPLVEGEKERAVEWAKRLAQQAQL